MTRASQMEEADIRTDALNYKELKIYVVNNLEGKNNTGKNNPIMSVLTSVQVLKCPKAGTFAWEQSKYSCALLMLESKNR